MTPTINMYFGYLAMIALFAIWVLIEKTKTGRKVGQWFDRQFK